MYAKIIMDELFKKMDSLESGRLTIVTPDGQSRTFVGASGGSSVKIEFKNWRNIPNMFRRGDIGFAEGYRFGAWDTDDLVGLTTLGLVNRRALERVISGSKLSRIFSMLSYLFKLNTLKGSRKNIHAHYDLGNAFYQLWLDSTMTYSSALYHNGGETLEQAQNNKYDRIIKQLGTESGNILEVGCGWGGFARRALKNGDFSIRGITLSDEQHDYASNLLGSSVDIVLEDYRHQSGKFDSIVSIEMFEAVGEKFWPAYFKKMAALLKKHGKAVIQTIMINEEDFPEYRRSGDFIRSYIFPGGMLPSSSRFSLEAKRAGLKCENAFYFGQDYAKTLQIWLDNFDDNREKVLALGFDEGFIRLWRFYLAGCIAGFRTKRTDVMQIELSHL